MSEQEKVEEFDFEWKSTPDERYDTVLMESIKVLISSFGTIIDEWGGTAFGEWSTSDGLASDNGIRAAMTLSQAADLAEAVSVVAGHPVKVTAHVESA